MTLHRLQIRAGRYFVHEHPRSAASWENPHIKALRDDPRTTLAEADLCQFGLLSKDKEGINGSQILGWTTATVQRDRGFLRKLLSRHFPRFDPPRIIKLVGFPNGETFKILSKLTSGERDLETDLIDRDVRPEHERFGGVVSVLDRGGQRGGDQGQGALGQAKLL